MRIVITQSRRGGPNVCHGKYQPRRILAKLRRDNAHYGMITVDPVGT